MPDAIKLVMRCIYFEHFFFVHILFARWLPVFILHHDWHCEQFELVRWFEFDCAISSFGMLSEIVIAFYIHERLQREIKKIVETEWSEFISVLLLNEWHFCRVCGAFKPLNWARENWTRIRNVFDEFCDRSFTPSTWFAQVHVQKHCLAQRSLTDFGYRKRDYKLLYQNIIHSHWKDFSRIEKTLRTGPGLNICCKKTKFV